MIVFYSAHDCVHELIYNDSPKKFLHTITTDVLVNVNFFTLPVLEPHIRILKQDVGDVNIHFNIEVNTFKTPELCAQKHIDVINELQDDIVIQKKDILTTTEFDLMIEFMNKFNWRKDAMNDYMNPKYVYMAEWFRELNEYNQDFSQEDFITIIKDNIS